MTRYGDRPYAAGIHSLMRDYYDDPRAADIEFEHQVDRTVDAQKEQDEQKDKHTPRVAD